MNEYLMTLAIMVVLLVVINVICFVVLRKSVHRMPISATLSYVVLAGTCYYIDVVLYALQWSIVIYILCFIVVPVAVYYVMYRIGSLKKQAEGTSPEGKNAHSGAELRDEAQSVQVVNQPQPQVVNQPQPQVVSQPQKNQPVRVSSGTEADISLSAARLSGTQESKPSTEKSRFSQKPVEVKEEKPVKPAVQLAAEALTATAPIPFKKADFDRTHSKGASSGAHAAVSETKDEVPEVSREASAHPQPAPVTVDAACSRHTVADITLPSQVKPAQEEPSVVQASSYDLAFEKAAQFKEVGRFAVAAAMYGKLAATAPTDDEGIKALFEEIACYISAKDKTKAYEKAKYLKENYRLDAGKTTKLHIIVQLLERD